MKSPILFYHQVRLCGFDISAYDFECNEIAGAFIQTFERDYAAFSGSVDTD
ncbi:TPA: hypothetical protein OO086_000574 [Legionella pneumophila]|nr:hypothetical protein [Legionella pneumophila]